MECLDLRYDFIAEGRRHLGSEPEDESSWSLHPSPFVSVCLSLSDSPIKKIYIYTYHLYYANVFRFFNKYSYFNVNDQKYTLHKTK